MIGCIWAENPERIIGMDGGIPWHHTGDFKRFKRITMGAAIIMGRKTFQSIGKALPGRLNIVLSRQADPFLVDGVVRCGSVEGALEVAALAQREAVWFIGGWSVYEEGIRHAEVLDVTYVQDTPVTLGVREIVFAPVIAPSLFDAGPLLDHEDAPGLTRRVFTRRTT